MPSLIYAVKIAKKPFSLVKGLDIINLVTSLTADLGTIIVTVVASNSHMVGDYFTGNWQTRYSESAGFPGRASR